MPEVSVVIPAYNAAAFLEEAVASVLDQTFGDFEVLVVDDGSTDGTEALARRFGRPVRCLRQENKGVAAARNRGIQAAGGRRVAFLDADDSWFAEKLERQIEALEQSPRAGVCYSAFMHVDESGAPLGVDTRPRAGSMLEDLLTRGNAVGSISSVLCERALLDRAGGFDPSLSQCADWDMWVRLAQLTEFLYIDRPLVTYRRHGNNMSRDPGLLERDSLQVLESCFSMPALPEAIRGKRAAAFGRNYMVLAGTYFRAGRYGDFTRCAARAVALDPRLVGSLLAFPLRVAKRLRNRKRV